MSRSSVPWRTSPGPASRAIYRKGPVECRKEYDSSFRMSTGTAGRDSKFQLFHLLHGHEDHAALGALAIALTGSRALQDFDALDLTLIDLPQEGRVLLHAVDKHD